MNQKARTIKIEPEKIVKELYMNLYLTLKSKRMIEKISH